MLRWLSIYTHPKMLIVLGLGFSSGLPLLLVGSTLGAWLTDAGLDKASIGTFALVALPYSFNFLWAPLIDRLPIPLLTKRFGRRRAWLLLTQALLLITIASLSLLNPAQDAPLLAWMAVIVAWLSASQDVVNDAFRVEYLDEKQYGEGAAVVVFGYRLGMLMAGAGALALADAIDWQIVYVCMGLGMVVGIITVLSASEPPSIATKADTPILKHAIIDPFLDFAKRYPQWILILLLIFAYRLPDGFIGFMTTPFFLDIGFSKSEIAAIAKLYGFGATLVGMFIGGALIHTLGVQRCLLYFLLVQIITNVSYILLSEIGPKQELLIVSITLDNASGGMITAAAVAYMMSLCNIEFTATQYALLSSLASLASKTLAGAAGWVADAYGWSEMFILSALLGVPALVLLGLLRLKGPQADASTGAARE